MHAKFMPSSFNGVGGGGGRRKEGGRCGLMVMASGWRSEGRIPAGYYPNRSNPDRIEPKATFDPRLPQNAKK